MNEDECKARIENEAKKRSRSIRNKNAFDALFGIFPPAHALWKIFSGAKDAIETEKGRITLDAIIEYLQVIDKKLSKLPLSDEENRTFEVLLDNVMALGDVTGIDGNTSNPILREIFSSNDISVRLKDVKAIGNITGVKLNVDKELELKGKLDVSNGINSLKTNPHIGTITLGKEKK